MVKECLWYNGETSCYELLDFNPNGLSNNKIKQKAWKILKEKYSALEEDRELFFKTLYLLDVDYLENVNKNGM